MVRIRLQRIGRKNSPSYRIVVMPQQKKRDGKFLEKLGNYDPTRKVYSLDKERYDYWISTGAQPSERVEKLASGQAQGYTLQDNI
ncbi:30S ribosomal protein S16 [candidate division WWE3 bacterium]|uniref:Small ribosomal subunit protein bS16 n=1 Tax=candidate division WWE3 bacterium TaxID=2053526 RepID=A0A955RQV0_UNCKA|nr:30S ribosomal protein S16 [candidate division WWE3 bacterium]